MSDSDATEADRQTDGPREDGRGGDRDRSREAETPAVRLGAADEGKRLVTPEGETIGTVVRVDETVHVAPRPRLLSGCSSWLTCPWTGADPFVLDTAAVERVTDEAVVVAAPRPGGRD